MTITAATINPVGEKGSSILGVDPNVWRKDECAAWIGRSSYGHADLDLGYGWEIDHIKPASEGGGDELSNLRPLQWRNNRGKQAGRLVCVVISSGSQNTLTR